MFASSARIVFQLTRSRSFATYVKSCTERPSELFAEFNKIPWKPGYAAAARFTTTGTRTSTQRAVSRNNGNAETQFRPGGVCVSLFSKLCICARAHTRICKFRINQETEASRSSLEARPLEPHHLR